MNEGDVIKGISFDKVKEVVQSTLLLFNVIVPLFIYIFSSEMKGNYKACVFEVWKIVDFLTFCEMKKKQMKRPANMMAR